MSENTQEKCMEWGDGRCEFCRQKEVDPAIVGETYSRGGLTVHQFCLYFSSGLAQAGGEDEGINGFLLPDIWTELRRGGKFNMRCVECKAIGAYVGCSVTRCRRVGHFPCMHKSGFLFQYFGCFKAFCHKHRPTQPFPGPTPSPTSQQTSCCVCLSPVECYPCTQTLYCPACFTFFHPTCLQTQARTTGRHHFRCAVCGNRNKFVAEMLRMGIDIPERDAEWESMGHFSGAYSVTASCHATLCLCSEGRNHATGLGKFRMRKCVSCGQCLGHVECTRDQGSHCVDCSILQAGGVGPSQEMKVVSRKRVAESHGKLPPKKKSRLSISSKRSVVGPQVTKQCTCGICIAKRTSNWESNSSLSSEDESSTHCTSVVEKRPTQSCPHLLNPRVVLTRIPLSTLTKLKRGITTKSLCSPARNFQTISLTDSLTSKQELPSSIAPADVSMTTEIATPAEVSIAIEVSIPAEDSTATEISKPAEDSIATEISTPAEDSIATEISTQAEDSIATAVTTLMEAANGSANTPETECYASEPTGMSHSTADKNAICLSENGCSTQCQQAAGSPVRLQNDALPNHISLHCSRTIPCPNTMNINPQQVSLHGSSQTGCDLTEIPSSVTPQVFPPETAVTDRGL